MAKSILASKPEGVEYKLVCIGDKSKGKNAFNHNKSKKGGEIN
jgi:hypothetical protein